MKSKLYPKYFETLPSWEDIIKDLDINLRENESNVRVLPYLGFVTHNGNRIESVANITKEVQKLFPEKHTFTQHIYISMMSNSQNFGRHKDTMSVCIISAQGKITYIVEDEEEITYDLEPGDMLFVPEGMYHTPVVSEPRAIVSIGFY